MMSTGDIREHSRIAARKAAQAGLRPFVVEADNLADFHLTVRAGVPFTFPFPFIGDHTPLDFTPTGNRCFVEATGFGAGSEPALTRLAFVKRLRERYGYAVVEGGQFQASVQEYEPARAKGGAVMARSADLLVHGGSTVYLLRPASPAGAAWVDEHILEGATWFGGAVAVEHRYILDIVVGAAADGLRVR